MLTNENFYTLLPTNAIALGELLLSDHLFHRVPQDWHIIITDIKGSTKAVAVGMHENVNLIATGSIVTVLNLAFKKNIQVPFFFGGDGATFIVPAVLLEHAIDALSLYQKNTSGNFGLDLRVGSVAVQQIYENGYELRLSKFNSSPVFPIPVILGDGLAYAEKLIKGEDYLTSAGPTVENEVDLSGMQCRWDRIAPPEDKEEIVTLLVIVCQPGGQAVALSKVLGHLDRIYGGPEKRQPISVGKLKLKTTFHRLGTEMRARLGQVKFLELLRDWLISLYGIIYFKTQTGKDYLESLVSMADTLVLDGKINTVITGSVQQRKDLEGVLDALEVTGEIAYGLHVSNDSVMSCYVRDLKDGHIHFVDGGEGGYTRAASVLKSKFRKN